MGATKRESQDQQNQIPLLSQPPQSSPLPSPLPKKEDPEKLTEDELVFCHWQKRQRNPKACLYTEEREKRILHFLTIYSVDELKLLIDWVYDSDHERAIFLRKTECTDLVEILRYQKVTWRMERAKEWQEENEDPGIIVKKPAPTPAPVQAVRASAAKRR